MRQLLFFIILIASCSGCESWEPYEPQEPYSCNIETTSDRGQYWSTNTSFLSYDATVDDSLLLVQSDYFQLVNKNTGNLVHQFGSDFVYMYGEQYWYNNYMLAVDNSHFGGVDLHNRKVDFKIFDYTEPYYDQITGIGEDFFVLIKTSYHGDSLGKAPTLFHGSIQNPQQLEEVATPNFSDQISGNGKSYGLVQDMKAFISPEGTRQILMACMDFVAPKGSKVFLALYDYDKKEWIYDKKYLPNDPFKSYNSLRDIFFTGPNEAMFVNYNQLIRWDIKNGEIMPDSPVFNNVDHIAFFGGDQNRAVVVQINGPLTIIDNHTHQVISTIPKNTETVRVDINDKRLYLFSETSVRVFSLEDGTLIDVLLPDCISGYSNIFRYAAFPPYSWKAADGKRFVLMNTNTAVLKYETK